MATVETLKFSGEKSSNFLLKASKITAKGILIGGGILLAGWAFIKLYRKLIDRDANEQIKTKNEPNPAITMPMYRRLR